MERFRELIFGRGVVSFVGSVIALIAALVAGIVYAVSGGNEFNPDISILVVVLYSLSAAVSLLSLFIRLRELKAIAFFLALAGLLFYVGTQANYLANIFTAIDGSSASASLIIVMVCSVLALIAGIVGFAAYREKKSASAVVAVSERND